MIKGKWFSVVQGNTGTFWKVKFNFCRVFLGYSISDFDKDCGIILLQSYKIQKSQQCSLIWILHTSGKILVRFLLMPTHKAGSLKC